MVSFAKITRPVLSRVLERERLIQRVADALESHPIAWIAAPAGSGKTVLAECVARARGGPCLWFQADPRDGDPTSFFFYLRTAAGRLVPRRRETLPVLTPAHALSPDSYARNFFEQLGARLRPGTLVVLDDYQEIAEDAPLQRLLPGALAALPATIRVVVASRAAPPAPFARLVTHGRIGMVGEADLALTEEETRALAHLQRAPELDASDVAALRRRSGGWFAGTILLLAGGGGGRAAAEASAPDVLFDYFAAEIFDRAPATIRRFLLETALLPNVSVPAAALLTGEERSAEILGELVRRNYFTVRRAGAEAIYQYHPLFRAFLLARARKAFPRERWSELVRRATDTLRRDGALEDAAALMMEAGDHARLAQLAIAEAPALARQGRLATLYGWLTALPAEIRGANPWASFWLGLCREKLAPSEARVHLERAYEQFKARGDAAGVYAAWSAVVRTYLVVWGRFDPLDRWIAELGELRRRFPAYPSLEVEAGVARGIAGGLMWRQSGHPDIESWVSRCATLLRADLAPEMKSELAMAASFYLQWFKGDLASHARILDETRPLLAVPGVPAIVTLLWRLNEASYRGRLGDRDACYAAVESGFATLSTSGLEVHGLSLSLQAIYGALASNDVAGARRFHEQARAWLRDADVTGKTYHGFAGVWIALCEGDFARAAQELRQLRASAGASGAEFARAWSAHTIAHALVEQGRHDDALAELDACLEWARTNRNPVVEHHCALSIAYALLCAARDAEAVEALRPAMALGREHGFVRHPWIGWRHDVMSRLCALALEHAIEVDHVRAQIRASRLAPPASPPESWPFPIRIRTLGAFEVWRDGERIPTDGRANRKPLELLQAIVALGGREIREDTLAEALWPDAEGDAAHHAMETNLYRLRKLVGGGAVVQRGGRLSLDRAVCFADALVAERAAADANTVLDRSAAHPDQAAVRRRLEHLVRVYRGPFLPRENDGVTWAEAARDRIRHAIARILTRIERSGPAQAFAAQVRAQLAHADPELASPVPVALPTGSDRERRTGSRDG